MNNYKWMGSLGLLAMLVGFASAQAKLEGVATNKSGTGLEVVVTGKNLGQPKVFRTKQNRSYTLEWNASLATKPGRTNVNLAGVNYVWRGWYTSNPPRVRVQLWLASGKTTPKLIQTSNGWTVAVGNTATSATTTTSSAATEYAKIYEKGNFNDLPPIVAAVVQPAPTANFDVAPVIPADQKPKATPGTGTTSTTSTASTASQQPKTLATIAQGMTTKPVLDDGDRMVSLEFNNTEIALILRGLAAQSGVNIVTSPEVTGRINVKMENVTLRDALNMVTTIANIRYTKIGDTYLVTSTERFSDAIRQVIGKLEESGETRVITLKSGEGKQIKAAAIKAIPQLSSDGVYDILVPTEAIKTKTASGSGNVSGSGSASAAGSAAPAGAPAGGNAQASGSASVGASGQASSQTSSVELVGENEANKGGKDAYVVVIASKERIDEVVEFVTTLDDSIADANSLNSSSMGTRVVPLYSPNGQVVLETLKSVVTRDPKAPAFKLSVASTGTAGNEEATQLLVIMGPNSSLDSLETLAKATDAGIAMALGITVPENEMQARRMYEVVDLQWVEPLEAATELQTAVRGLVARMMPAPVDPNVGGKKTIGTTSTSTEQASNAGNTVGGSTTSSTGQGSGSTGTTASAGTSTSEGTAENKLEKNLGTEPMKLLLFGTRAQIDQARQLLATIDIEPQMVAFEIRAVEMSKDDATKAGIDWSTITGGIFNAISFTPSLGAGGSGLGVSGSYTNRSTTTDVDVWLDSLVTDNKILARPNTLAMDGRMSKVFIGDTVRYIESLQGTQNGVTVTTGKVDVGTTFSITPRISPDGTIRVNLDATLSILRGFTEISDSDFQSNLPQTSSRELKNSFVMNSGDIVALGGLIQDSDRVSVSGIPILKDLPIIGALFRSQTNTRVRSEVVFFITAKLVDRANRATAADPKNNGHKGLPKFNEMKPEFPKVGGKKNP